MTDKEIAQYYKKKYLKLKAEFVRITCITNGLEIEQLYKNMTDYQEQDLINDLESIKKIVDGIFY